MEPFTEWLRQQMHQQGLNCRTLARRSGLTTCKIKQAVAQHVVPTAINVCRLAECFDVDPEAVLDLAATQTAATMPADYSPLEREFVRLLYVMSGAERRIIQSELEARVRAHQARALAVA